MVEPKSLVKHANGFMTWHRHDDAIKAELWSTVIADSHRLILVDPAPLDINVLNEVMKIGTPVAIFVTSGNHERDCERFRAILNVPIATSAGAIPHLKIKPEIVLDPSMRPYHLTPVSIEGAGPGEVALYHAPTKSLVLGDAIIHMEKTGLCLLPEKYCENAVQMRESLKKLADLDFDSLFFAHGEPILSGAREKFLALVK